MNEARCIGLFYILYKHKKYAYSYMRILFYVLGFIAFSIFGFFMIGVIVPVTEYENTIVVNRSLDKTWKVFSSDTLIYDWMQGLKKIEAIKGTKMQAGAEFKMYLNEGGQDYTIIEKVRDVQEKSLYAITIDNEALTNNVATFYTITQALSFYNIRCA